ncbi:MAG: ABC transporter permease [Planctomycetes bacterium]|nr:ABC transporter permease [Planctomycetota bacterium]
MALHLGRTRGRVHDSGGPETRHRPLRHPLRELLEEPRPPRLRRVAHLQGQAGHRHHQEPAQGLAIPIGVFSAVWKDSAFDRVVTVLLFIDYSLPHFFTALLLLLFFTIGKPLQWFPTSNFQGPEAHALPTLAYMMDVAWHLVLPVAVLSSGSFAALSRYMRAGLLEVIRSDYIRTARAKGLSEWVVIMKHGLRNGLIPILTMVGNILPAMIGGSVIIEYIFNIPGMGLLMIEAIFGRDYNLVMADAMIAGFLVLCGILVTDILYVLVDPRISFD